MKAKTKKIDTRLRDMLMQEDDYYQHEEQLKPKKRDKPRSTKHQLGDGNSIVLRKPKQ
jgi:hypothetical protein